MHISRISENIIRLRLTDIKSLESKGILFLIYTLSTHEAARDSEIHSVESMRPV